MDSLTRFILNDEHFRKGPYTESDWKAEYKRFRAALSLYWLNRGIIVDWPVEKGSN